MHCPNCGKEFIAAGQKFCQNCGFDTSNISEVEPTYFNVRPNRPVKKKKSMDPYSKKRLIFGIASLLAASSALNFGINVLTSRFSSTYGYYSNITAMAMRVDLIIVMVIHLVGLILGILSVYNNSLIQKLELETSDNKFVSLLGILGSIINIIGFILAIFVGVMFLS